jgi:hypothetical protein
MTISVKHTFASPKADGVDSTLVQPSNWNAEHTFTAAAGKVLGRNSSGAGAIQELPLSFDATGQSMIPPSGNTASRPATPAAGMFRYNTTTAKIELYTNSAWGAVAGGATVSGTAPASPSTGDLWYNSTLGEFQTYNGSAWVTGAPADGAVTPPKLALGAWTSVASASTVNLGAQTSLNIIVTGTATITSFGTTAVTHGLPYRLRFAAALTLTNGANLILPSATNITTAAGDVADVVYDGSNVWRVINYALASGRSLVASPVPTIQAFTTSGTFTVPAGVTKVKVTVVGGGGGGTTATSSTPQGGGGAGGAAIKVITGLTPGGTVAVTVDPGGAAETAGGTSSFGTYCSATGGARAAVRTGNPGPGGAGGTGSGGDVNFTGGAGTGGSGVINVVAGNGGTGGNSIFGGGGLGGTGVNGGAAGAGGPNTGGGGAGGNSANSSPNAGGAGGSGIVIVEY